MAFELDSNDETFVQLKTGAYPWWDNLKKNNKISIQIRKDNTIDVYYNGGAILSGLKYDRQKFTASIHPKYIPIQDDHIYRPLSLDSSGVEFTGQFDPLAFSQFEDEKIEAVTKHINKYYGSESEKAIQYKFATTDPFIIDTEFQMGNALRIDLVRLDSNAKKIVFIEVKTIGDSRLFSDPDDDPNHIYHQLNKYRNFIAANSNDILAYYTNVLKIKADLGIITDLKVSQLSLTGWQVEPKPLLAFGDCNQKWIDQNADNIDTAIKEVACGAYYFGAPKYSLDLILTTNKNRHIL
jgi:hypothetical protein